MRIICLKHLKITQALLDFLQKITKHNKPKEEKSPVNTPLIDKNPQITISTLGDIPPVFYTRFTPCFKISPLKARTLSGYADQKRKGNATWDPFHS